MFSAALVTIASVWKQTKCPSIGQMECYLATKKNEILPFATTLMDLECILLSEMSQTKEDKYHMISRI